MYGEEQIGHAQQRESRGRGIETVSAMDEAATTTDSWAMWILTATLEPNL